MEHITGVRLRQDLLLILFNYAADVYNINKALLIVNLFIAAKIILAGYWATTSTASTREWLFKSLELPYVEILMELKKQTNELLCFSLC